MGQFLIYQKWVLKVMLGFRNFSVCILPDLTRNWVPNLNNFTFHPKIDPPHSPRNPVYMQRHTINCKQTGIHINDCFNIHQFSQINKTSIDFYRSVSVIFSPVLNEYWPPNGRLCIYPDWNIGIVSSVIQICNSKMNQLLILFDIFPFFLFFFQAEENQLNPTELNIVSDIWKSMTWPIVS